MISGIFHKGSGIGNQLHRYVGTRVAALDKGEEFGMVAPDLFKGKDFLNLDMGKAITDYHILYPEGRTVPNVAGTFLDEEFQNENVWKHRESEVREWLTPYTTLPEVGDNVCVINFRGGEYKYFPELYLPKEYWDLAIENIKKVNPRIHTFIVQTDDEKEARKFFPDFPIDYGEPGLNWDMIYKAKYLILSNSSFAILPACLGRSECVIAPKYWARYNTKEWLDPDNATYSKFTYIHHEENTR